MTQAQLTVGPQTQNTSLPVATVAPMRGGNSAETIVQQYHGRFTEQNYRGNLYSIGFTDTVLSATTTGSATSVAAAATPILGLWNNSVTMNLVIEQALLQMTTIVGSCTNPKGFNYWVSGNQKGLTLGTLGNAVNCSTLKPLGSIATTFVAGATALTGLTGNMSLLRGVGIGPIMNTAGNATAVSFPQGNCIDNVDASIIVPPGGVLAILSLAATSTPVNMSGALIWDEVPI